MLHPSDQQWLWDMPLGFDSLQLRFQRELVFGDRAGTTPETSLRGALFGALINVACLESGRCTTTVAGHPCRQQATCPVGWLYHPRCPQQRRDHASPLNVRIGHTTTMAWDVDVLLWGQHALGCRPHVVAAFEQAGLSGLGGTGGPVPFACQWQGETDTTLAAQIVDAAPQQARLHFDSPCQSRASTLAALLGNAAHDLMQWALVDSGQSATLRKRGCDMLADATRAEAEASIEGVSCRWLDRQGADIGTRQSRSNRGRFELKGFVGMILLEGDLSEAWRWLRLLALRGGGGRRGFGLGQVRLEAL